MHDFFERTRWLAAMMLDSFRNYLYPVDLSYVTEAANWAIRSVGEELLRAVAKQRLWRALVTTTDRGIRHGLIHYGSWPVFQQRHTVSQPSIVTFWHMPAASLTAGSMQKLRAAEVIHTASSITKNALLAAGVAQEKIAVLPLGIHLSTFTPGKAHLPTGRFIIGSFQKDGQGWGAGREPKFIKGPDLFVQTVLRVAKQLPIHVLLIGPARGYVKNALEKNGISFTDHGYVRTTQEVANCYRLLDLYLITSRVEGGPRQLLEAWASGVPVVTTNVGMVADVARDGVNAWVAHEVTTDALVHKVEQVLQNESARIRIVEQARRDVIQYSWEKLAPAYYARLYQAYA